MTYDSWKCRSPDDESPLCPDCGDYLHDGPCEVEDDDPIHLIETDGPPDQRWAAQRESQEGEPVAAYGATRYEAILDLLINVEGCEP